MRSVHERFLLAVGALVLLVSLLGFSLQATGTALGQETDVGLTTDVPADDVGAGQAAPPASLPDTGSAGVLQDEGMSTLWFGVGLLGAGLTLVSAGLAVRRAQATRPHRDT